LIDSNLCDTSSYKYDKIK